MSKLRYTALPLYACLLATATWLGCGGGVTGGGGEAPPDAATTQGSSGESSSGDPTSSSGSSSSSSSSSSGGENDAGSPCGNGALDPNEACDDGNATAGDGCSPTCTVESGWTCAADAGAAGCTPICGNSTVQPREACDLGASNGTATSGCSASCAIPVGFSCGLDGGTETCAPVCGDGVTSGTETCDDGPLNGEPGHCNEACAAAVAAICGDGRVQAGEGCDDGANNGQPGYCAANCPVPTAPQPAQATTFSGNTRGYWFTAPKDFVITSVRVPTDASSGNQSIAVLRFPAAPPLYSATTNTFDTLFLVQDSAQQTAFDVKIPVSSGDVIGVLGWRGDINSYGGPGDYATTVDGAAVTFQRMGFQYSLTTTAPKEIWREANGYISRVDMTYAKTQCGDGVRVASEGCDDGNLADGDGCSATCTVETGFTCSEGALKTAKSTCTATCGDSVTASSEGCDDGANNGQPGKCAAGCQGFAFDTTTHASASNAGTRGFWFTAPAAFTIRAIRVPTDVTGDEAFSVVRLLDAPPVSGAATNAFQTLAYTRGLASTSFTDVRIKVAAGDRIGVLGGRGTAAAIQSSVSGANPSASLAGTAIPLAPLAIDGSLDTAAPGNLHAGAAGNPIGRVELLVEP